MTQTNLDILVLELNEGWYERFCKRFSNHILNHELIDFASAYSALALHCALSRDRAKVVLQAWQEQGKIQIINSHGVRVLQSEISGLRQKISGDKK